jgi:hypothetical protein
MSFWQKNRINKAIAYLEFSRSIPLFNISFRLSVSSLGQLFITAFAVRIIDISFKKNLFGDPKVIYLYRCRINVLGKNIPIGDKVEEERCVLKKILKEAAIQSPCFKKKWKRKKRIRLRDDHIGEVLNNRRKAFKNSYQQTH